jgi:hypothetical protein
MIDTDKYEGHLASEGQPWAWSNWMLNNAETNEQHKATSALLNDAPLLLAEVKRLKIYERLVLCIAYHQQLPDGLYVDEELMLRAREHLRKNGEWEDEEE